MSTAPDWLHSLPALERLDAEALDLLTAGNTGHPGGIATNFASDTSSVMRFAYHTPLRHLMTSVDTGGRRLVWLAEGTPGVTWQSGEYYERNRPGKVNPQVADADLARGLWQRSEAMLEL